MEYNSYGHKLLLPKLLLPRTTYISSTNNCFITNYESLFPSAIVPKIFFLSFRSVSMYKDCELGDIVASTEVLTIMCE